MPLLLCVGSANHARAVVSEDVLPTSAEWLSADATPAPGTALFRRVFVPEPGLVKAVLLAAADRDATIFLNGTNVGQAIGFAQASTLDVTRFVRAGTNLLAVRVSSTSGPPAFRLMLELAHADGRQRWLVSDATWSASRQEAANWNIAPVTGTGWSNAFTHGAAGRQKWGDPFAATKSVDAYNSWMLARGSAPATDPATMSVRPGFRVELLRSALPEEDSWITLAFDPQGRLTVAREKRGLLRMTLGPTAVERVEVIEDTLEECRGLLYAHDSLYVNANNSRGFYRLRDADGDGRFEEKKLLLATTGGVGHGRNHLRLGPDGLIYLVHGDDVVLPPKPAPDSPVQQMVSDQLMPAMDPKKPQPVTRYTQVGHVLQTDREGSFFRLFAGGLRNPMDVAFNEAGELFTYDADMERDIGTPWYRPTRVLHLVPGGDYGWRRGPGNIPPHSPDTLPAAVDIGVGSPTGVTFGTGSKFPGKYRRAFFIADWAYGRILAVHLQPRGASYTGSSEEFLSGRPLNVTDLVVGPDGAMYFITGGRGTKSGLYRVSWAGEVAANSASTADDPEAVRARLQRRRFESFTPEATTPERLAEIWSGLRDEDRWIRSAARRALERTPLAQWSEQALTETNPPVAAHALLALARVVGRDAQPLLLTNLNRLPLAGLAEADQLAVLRTLGLSLARHGWPTEEMAASLRRQLEAVYPAPGRALNYELCRLLAHLRSLELLPRTLPLLTAAAMPDERLHYLMLLWPMREGWTLDRRRAYFTALGDAEREQGAHDYYAALNFIRRDLTNSLSSGERLALGDLVRSSVATPVVVVPPAPQFVKAWTLADFDFAKDAAARSPAKGREAFRLAGCVQCHRVGSEGGVIGPDLTAVAARFGGRDLLDHILNPSKAVDEKFRVAVLTLKDDAVVTGTVERDDDLVVLTAAEPGADPVEVSRTDIKERRWSDVSPMPTGLLDGLTKEQILDLLAFLEAAKGSSN